MSEDIEEYCPRCKTDSWTKKDGEWTCDYCGWQEEIIPVRLIIKEMNESIIKWGMR